jgi:transketolase
VNKIANRQVICDVLIEQGKKDRDIVVLCSDSRGSGSLTDFFKALPEQAVEVGIAEQNLVSISAGLAKCGKKPFAVSPACFITTRSMEQAKVDVAYSNTNVKLLGISGGVSYSDLGFTHHSTQDIAIMSSIPNMRVYIPSDRHQTKKLIEALLKDEIPAYIRIGRNPTEDIYDENYDFELNRSMVVMQGNDIAIIACGDMVPIAKEAGEKLSAKGISARVIDMYCLKPIDREAVIKAANETKGIVTIEEHTSFGGLGAMVSQLVTAENPVKVTSLCLPDAPVITGTQKQIWDYYGLNADGIITAVTGLI